MNNIQLINKNLGKFGVIFWTLVFGVPVTSLSQTMPVSQRQLCPSISSKVSVSRSQENSGHLTAHCLLVAQSTPPLPEELQPPSATVVPVNGTVNVRLVNQTYTDINYQVIGDTQPRILSGRNDVTLTTLQLPVTVTFQRPDRGLLLVTPQASEAGSLEVTLTETTNLDVDKTVMTIQETGDVFLN